MKKVNFKKLGKQFMAGLFGVALMGGVMLNTQEVEAQIITVNVPEIVAGGSNSIPCTSSWNASETSWIITCDTCRRTKGEESGTLFGTCKNKR